MAFHCRTSIAWALYLCRGDKISMYAWIFVFNHKVEYWRLSALLCFAICKLRLISLSEGAEINSPPSLKRSSTLSVAVRIFM